MKTIIITGGSDGIGLAAAKKLKAFGNEVAIVGRTESKTVAAAESLGCEYFLADYSRLSDVRRLAAELDARFDRIDVLANNAGGALAERTLTEDGVEKTFQVNVLGAFLLTRLLADKLCACGATVIQTSSIASNLFGADLDPDDFQSENDYDALKAYGRAKLCDVLFTRGLAARYGAGGMNAVAFEPGVVRTNFASEAKGFIKFCYHSPLRYFFTISPKRSAERLVRLATGTAGADFVPGQVYSGKKIMKLRFSDPDGAAADKLWSECERLIGE